MPEAPHDNRRLSFDGGDIDYVLVRRRGRRGVGLKVDQHGLTVSAPLTMPVSRVEALVRESERWVRRKIEEWRGRHVPVASWEEGAALAFLGESLRLRIARGTRAMAVRHGDDLHVVVRQPGEEPVRRAVVDWYKARAREHLAARVAALAAAAGLTAPRLFISPAMARWGSCNSQREVRLAWRLVKAPPELVDYVVCHELAHLRHMNHSAAFWREVERQCPDYRRLRAELFATDHLYRSF